MKKIEFTSTELQTILDDMRTVLKSDHIKQRVDSPTCNYKRFHECPITHFDMETENAVRQAIIRKVLSA